MNGREVQLISDGDGIAVVGEEGEVERFLRSEGLSSRDLGLGRLRSITGASAGATQAGSLVAAESGRWVKLTEESAAAIKKFGLMESSKTGLSMGVVQAKGVRGIKGIVQFAKGPGTLALNPAVLSGAAGIMSQLAMQQAMDEITDYLAKIDAKVDDILLAQKHAVLADLIGVDLVIDEAMTVRDHVGRVSEVTWSKAQSASMAVARAEGYALLQLDGLADRVDRVAKVGDLAKAAEHLGPQVREWLAVLARCFQLQDAMAILELERVLDASPEELDRHRLGIRAARRNRLERISQTTERLIARMDRAAEVGRRDRNVLLHPIPSRALVDASNRLVDAVIQLQQPLGITDGRESREARRWLDAAVDVKDRVIDSGAERVDATVRLGNESLSRARSATARLAGGIAARVPRRPKDDPQVPSS